MPKMVHRSTSDTQFSKDSSLLFNSEYARFLEQLGAKKKGDKFPESRRGETIFTVGNKLVYSKGEITDSTFANPESLELIKKYLPKSYKVYEEMLEVILNG